MIITCPACDAQYLLPDEAITAKGRRVKCTTCDYTWLQMPELPEMPDIVLSNRVASDSFSDILANSPVMPGERPQQKTVATPVVKSRNGKITVLWMTLCLTLLILVALFAGAVAMRHHIVARFPASALFFEKTGLAVPLPVAGVAFTDLVVKLQPENTLEVSGKVVNKTAADIRLPAIIVRMQGDGAAIPGKDWVDPVSGKILAAGQVTPFHYTLHDAPVGGSRVTILFSE